MLAALLPLLVVIAIIIAPRLLGSAMPDDLGQFARAQPVLWPSIALIVGSLLGLVLFPAVRHRPLVVAGEGMQDSIVPLFATSVVIGFGGVVVQTGGFAHFSSALLSFDRYPLLSMFGAVSAV